MDDVKRQLVKKNYNSWLTLNTEKKEISAEMNDYIKEVANTLEVKPTKVRKLFAALKKIEENGINEEAEVSELIDEVKGL